jgi:hypothetical protein
MLTLIFSGWGVELVDDSELDRAGIGGRFLPSGDSLGVT